MSIRRLLPRGQATAVLFLFLAALARPMSAQISNVLIPVPGKTSMVSLDHFKPDLVVPDSVFECGTPGMHPADLLLPVDAIEYSAAVPSRANEMMSMIVFVDSTGSILRFAERRGEPIRADTRGMTPSELGAAVQAAALKSRSTIVSVDYRTHRASATNRGGGRPDVMVVADPALIANLDVLGKPGDLAARVVAMCRPRR
jgi:hypothetical protein